jgi:DNA repair protein RadC
MFTSIDDKTLLCRLFKFPKKKLIGKNIRQMIENLEGDNEKADLVKEVCDRYGEIRISNGSDFKNSSQIYDHFRVRLGNQMQESFICIYLDNKHRIIKEQVISLGILNKSLVHPRECFATAIKLRSAAIILVHCHPSGDPTPSSADINITKRLAQVGEVIGISVLDHIIIGNNSYYSFVDEDMMPN